MQVANYTQDARIGGRVIFRGAIMPRADTPSDVDAIKERVAQAAQQTAVADEEEGPLIPNSTDEDHYMGQTSVSRSTGGAIEPYRNRSRDLGMEHFKIPRLKLLQPLSQECKGEEPMRHGTWYLEGDPAPLGPEIQVAPLFAFLSRTYLIPGQGQLCRSSDMVYGQGTPGIACADCALKDWPEKSAAGEGRGGPPCSEVLNFPVVIIPTDGSDDYQLGLVGFMRTGWDAGKMINTIHLQSKREHYYDTQIKLGRFNKSGKKGDYWVPTVSRDGKTPAGVAEYAAEMAVKLDDATMDRSLSNDD